MKFQKLKLFLSLAIVAYSFALFHDVWVGDFSCSPYIGLVCFILLIVYEDNKKQNHKNH